MSSPSQASRRDIIGIVASVIVACLVLALSWHKIESLDTGYHLAYGGRVLDGQGIVDRDPFIYPEHAVWFVNANWGSQVIMAAAYRVGGAGGLIALRTMLVVVIFAGIAAVIRSFTRSPVWLAVCWVIAALGAYERMSLRPELFSYAVMVWVLALVHGLKTRRAGVAVVLLQLTWVNLHSYFLVGPMMTGAFFVDALVGAWRQGSNDSRARARRLGGTLLLQIVVCFINPWTYRGAIFPIETLAYLKQMKAMGGGPGEVSGSSWSLISEFHSPFKYLREVINQRTIHAYEVFLVIAAVGTIVCLVRVQIGATIVLVLLTAMSMQMRRNIAQFALAGAPLAIGVIASIRAEPWRKGARILACIAGVLGGWWTVQIGTGRFYFDERRITRQFGTGLSDRTFPREAATWLASHADLQPNLFVDYFSSSNTLLWLPPRFKLFVDTNTFACPEPVLATAFDVGLGRVEHQSVFDRSRVNVVMLHCGPDTQTLVRRLVADYTNWALVHFDRQAVVFVRRIPEHVAVIRANPVGVEQLDVAGWIGSYDEPANTKSLSLGSAASVPLSLGWHAPAAALAREAVRLAPDYYDGWYFLAVSEANLGNADRRAGKMADAVGHYQEALHAAERVINLAPDYNAAAVRQVREDMTHNLAAASAH